MSLLAQLHRGGWLRTVDHALAESLRHARADTPDAVLAAAALASRAIGQGHSCLPLAQAQELLLDIAGDREPPALPATEDWLALLHASPWVAAATGRDDDGCVLVLEHGALALRRYHDYEARLASALLARTASIDPTPDRASSTADHRARQETRIAQLFPEAADGPQAAAARAALGQRLLLLTGGPGTGKTSTVARILVLFAEQLLSRNADAAVAPRIFLAAPTGKAAARLAESVRENLARLLAEKSIDPSLAAASPSQAQTLHRLLGWQSGSAEFKHRVGNPLPADLVVVDEASMIDLPLMCKLLEAVAPQATLVLIGDRDQLPSVETGDVLAALCDAAAAASNPGHALARQRIHLTHTHRQAGDVDVAALAACIRDGRGDDAVAGLDAGRFRGVHWHPGSDRKLAEAVLAQALPAYRAVQSADTVEAALAAARAFRVLTAVRDGAAGSQTLNAIIARVLDPARRGEGFFHGRLLLVTENSYRHNLFNGDIGIVWPDERHELRVWFDGDGGPRSWLTAALPAHESAFALTVHKSQGSEFDQVFLALPERGARVISRELLYTGLTRCRRGVALWVSEPVLREGIARKAQRWSGLGARLA